MMKKLLFVAFCAMSVIGLTAYGDDDRAYTNGQSKEYLKTDEQRKEIELAKEYLKTADMEYPTPKTAEMACIVGDLGMLKKMEENGFRLWNNPELIGNAVYFGHIDCCKYLLSKGADANAADKDGWSVLHFAASGGNVDVCKYLVSQGADVNAMNKDGWSVLYAAARGGNVDVCKYLVSQGADVNAMNKDGETALDIAKKKGHTAVVEYLESIGAK